MIFKQARRKDSHYEKLPVDALLAGASGGTGYGLYRLGSGGVRLNKDLNSALSSVGISPSTKFNRTLLERLDSLGRNADPNRLIESAYIYPEFMHYAAREPLFEGGAYALAHPKGLKQMHDVGGAVSDVLREDVGKPIDRKIAKIKRLLGGRFGSKNLPEGIATRAINTITQNVDRVAGHDLRAGRAHLRHFKAFSDSPVAGYLKLLEETADHASRSDMSIHNMYVLLNESRNFAKKGFPSQEAYFRDMLYRDFPEVLKGGTASSGAIRWMERATLSDVSRGAPVFDYAVSDFNRILREVPDSVKKRGDNAVYNYVMRNGFGYDSRPGTEGYSDLLIKDKAGKVVKDEFGRNVVKTPEQVSIFDQLASRLKRNVNVKEQLASPYPGGIQAIKDDRGLLHNLAEPIIGKKAINNSMGYSGTGKLVRLIDKLRGKKFLNGMRAVKGLGVALPVLAGIGIYGRHRSPQQKKAEFGFEGDYVRSGGGFGGATPAVERVAPTKPAAIKGFRGHFLNNLKGKVSLLAGLALLATAGYGLYDRHRK